MEKNTPLSAVFFSFEAASRALERFCPDVRMFFSDCFKSIRMSAKELSYAPVVSPVTRYSSPSEIEAASTRTSATPICLK